MAKKKIGKIVFLIVICLFLAVQLYPVLWLFLASIKPTTELSAAPFALPKSPTLANYIKIFSDGKILGYMWNSFKITAVSIVLIVFLSATAGFAISKFRFKLTGRIYAFLLSAS